MSTYTFSYFSIINQLNALKEKGEITPEALEAALQADARLSWDICRLDLDVYMYGECRARDIVEKLYRVPRVFLWVMGNEELFAALPMDHAEYVRAMLAIPDEGINARVRFELVQCPSLLRYLREEERWEVLAAGIRRFGDRVSGYWVCAAARAFGEEPTRAFLLQQLQDPAVATAFVTSPDRQAAWTIFDTVPRLIEAMRIVTESAPVEFLAHAREITTRLGEMENGVPVNDQWHMYWSNTGDGSAHHKAHGPAGEPHVRELIKLADLRLLARGLQNGEVDGLTPRSKKAIEQLREEKPDCMQIAELVQLICPFPDSETVWTVLHKLKAIMTPRNAHLVYRWALSGTVHSWESRQTYPIEESLKVCWWHPFLKKMVEEHGWQFMHVERRENNRARMGYDLQVTINDRNPRVVWTQDDTYYSGHDRGSVVHGTEVLVPPKEMRTCVHRTDRIVIYRDRMHPAAGVTSDMKPAAFRAGWSVYDKPDT